MYVITDLVTGFKNCEKYRQRKRNQRLKQLNEIYDKKGKKIAELAVMDLQDCDNAHRLFKWKLV
jgi:hypothetical protein